MTRMTAATGPGENASAVTPRITPVAVPRARWMPRLTVVVRLTDCSTATAETAAHEVWPRPTRWARMPATAAATATRIASGRNGADGLRRPQADRRRGASWRSSSMPATSSASSRVIGTSGKPTGRRSRAASWRSSSSAPSGGPLPASLACRASRMAVSAWATSASSTVRRLVLRPAPTACHARWIATAAACLARDSAGVPTLAERAAVASSARATATRSGPCGRTSQPDMQTSHDHAAAAAATATAVPTSCGCSGSSAQTAQAKVGISPAGGPVRTASETSLVSPATSATTMDAATKESL